MADDHNQPIIIKKKKGGHAGPHGGAWKLAYADFVTAMMAFFLVMWIIGMDVQTKMGLAEYFSNPGAFKVNFQSSPHPLQLDGRPASQQIKVEISDRQATNIDIDAAASLAATIESTLNADGLLPRLADNLSIRITDKGLVIEILENKANGSVFEPGTATLKPDARRLLQAVAPRLIGSRKGIAIEGHVSARVPAGERWEVSVNRANVARRELTAIGVKSSEVLWVSGKADVELKTTDNPQALSNDRISIIVPLDKS
jgi:chemotaxis protein MotB